MGSRELSDLHKILVDAYKYAKDVFNKKYEGKYCIKISCTYRSIQEQKELYAKGRTVEGKIVTNCNGVDSLSKHNINPSHALDVFVLNLETRNPDWDNLNLYREFATYMLEHNPTIVWGGLWKGKLMDYPHFEI